MEQYCSVERRRLLLHRWSDSSLPFRSSFSLASGRVLHRAHAHSGEVEHAIPESLVTSGGPHCVYRFGRASCRSQSLRLRC